MKRIETLRVLGNFAPKLCLSVRFTCAESFVPNLNLSVVSNQLPVLSSLLFSAEVMYST